MKIVISEKQYKLLVGDVEEQSDPAAAAPSTGTGSTGSKQGYPEVGKWESGVTKRSRKSGWGYEVVRYCRFFT